jgi:hypothetical protein
VRWSFVVVEFIFRNSAPIQHKCDGRAFQSSNNTQQDQIQPPLVKDLHKCIELQITHSSPKLFNIILCNISVNVSTSHWDQHRLNQMMGFTNLNQCGMTLFIAAILMTNVLEMVALLNTIFID